MAVSVAGLTFRGGAEHGGDVVVAFDVGLLREIQVTAIRLRFARECGLQVVLGLASLERSHVESLYQLNDLWTDAPGLRRTQPLVAPAPQ